ncbi:hypothetical protein EC991_000848 [Linnemannia zychae]|nr:hypothetical protein EC991_000848 [Linnemannia zychae]
MRRSSRSTSRRDHLSRLPVECLEAIIHMCLTLVSPWDARPTLAALCRVNKQISRIAYTVLYQSPFRLTKALSSGFSQGPRSGILVRSLLTQTPAIRPLSSILILGLDLSNNIPSPSLLCPTRLSRLALIRHLNIESSAFLEYVGPYFGGKWITRPFSAAQREYIYGREFTEMYLVDRKDATCFKERENDQLSRYYPNVLYREATWTLAEPILEQLESLTFPLSDIRRYLQVIDRLERLEHVNVQTDLVLYCYCCLNSEGNERREKRAEEEMRRVIWFVKEHVRLFPGRLLSVNPVKSEFWAQGRSFPTSVTQEIFEMLPCTYKPTSISSYNWTMIATFIDIIDLSGVREVRFIPPNVHFGQLLQRCRSLRSINLKSLIRDCFDWAVEEKKGAERLDQGSLARNLAPGGNQTVSSLSPQSLQPAYLKHGLAKLAKVTLKECHMPARYLDAIAFGFNHSLEVLTIDCVQAPAILQTIHLGRGWAGLSVLSCLKLHAPGHRLALDSLLFAQCPSLTEVRITDNTFDYARQDIVPWQPAQTPKLKSLYLKGWSALAFNPAMLKSAKDLGRLKLSMTRREGLCFIPPVDELDEPHDLKEGGSVPRPQWTWDWELPNLVELNLNSEFAYRFEFRLLEGCRFINTLRLHMRTADSNPTRVISRADLITRGRIVKGCSGRMYFSTIRKVYMNGHWMFEDLYVFEEFLCYLFPRLYELDARGWGGVTVGNFGKVLKGYGGNIKLLRTDLAGPSEEEENEMKVYRRSSIYMKTKEYVRSRLFCSGVEYVLWDDGDHEE